MSQRYFIGRAEQRTKRKLEQNPFVVCNEIQKKYVPELFRVFDDVTVPRKTGYITYDRREMLGTMYYKAIAVISSIQEMTRTFNNEQIVSKLYHFIGADKKEYLPHGVTENEYLKRVDPEELEEIQKKIVYGLIRRRTFEDARLFRKWLIIIEGA